MRLIAKTTLRGKVNGEIAVWPKGSEFDDSVEPIPDEIIKEYESGSGTLRLMDEGEASKKKASPKKPDTFKKPRKTRSKPKAKVEGKPELEKTSSKKGKRKLA